MTCRLHALPTIRAPRFTALPASLLTLRVTCTDGACGAVSRVPRGTAAYRTSHCQAPVLYRAGALQRSCATSVSRCCRRVEYNRTTRLPAQSFESPKLGVQASPHSGGWQTSAAASLAEALPPPHRACQRRPLLPRSIDPARSRSHSSSHQTTARLSASTGQVLGPEYESL